MTLDATIHAARGDLADLALAGKLFVPHYARPMEFHAAADATNVHSEADDQSGIAATLAKGDAFSASAKARASPRVLFIFQLVPIHGVFISCIPSSQRVPNRPRIP